MGTQWLEIKVGGAALMSSIGGPFQVEMGIVLEYTALCTASHTTESYAADLFEPPALFVGCSDRIEGGNLLVEAEVEVSAAGWYTMSGSLAVYYYWGYWQDIESTNVQVYLMPGTQTVSISFMGLLIYNNGIDGPYRVVLTLNHETNSFADDVEHMTDPYLYTDFNTSPIRFTGNAWDYGNDLDGNGVFEQLVVEVEVEGAVPRILYPDRQPLRW